LQVISDDGGHGAKFGRACSIGRPAEIRDQEPRQRHAQQVTAAIPIGTPDASPFERHYTPKELAALWRLDESTIRKLFQDEPGVFKIGQAGRRNRRDYVTLRIPESTAARFYKARMERQ
jgi:hypothetical protein